jgi:sec-independent protein translocase protein TatB
VFGNLGLPELAIIVLFGLVIFGPDRLPKAASDAAQMIKKLRAMSHTAMDDFRSDLGPEFKDLDIRSLHPRRIVEDAWHSWDDQSERAEEDEGDTEPSPARTTAAKAPKPGPKRTSARTPAPARRPGGKPSQRQR